MPEKLIKTKVKIELRQIKRQCNVCGEKMLVKLFPDGNYIPGHYFGKMRIADRYVPTNQAINIGKVKHPIVKSAGKIRKYEYWECDKCYEVCSK